MDKYILTHVGLLTHTARIH